MVVELCEIISLFLTVIVYAVISKAINTIIWTHEDTQDVNPVRFDNLDPTTNPLRIQDLLGTVTLLDVSTKNPVLHLNLSSLVLSNVDYHKSRWSTI